jgi:peptidoglycan/xylan/chitin deacetylase (PgdA/CDA1 family)
MHHRVLDHVDSEFDMTGAWFRAELERLHREGYHPIRTIDLVRRSFDTVPAGKTPVVLTFDDGSPGQFGYRGDGSIDPSTAVGILLDFHREHPDFPAVASFYVNRDPFGFSDARQALGDLTRRGFEIGNHTFDHVDLAHVSGRKVEAEFGKLQRLVEHAVPGYRPLTMALPLGIEPRQERLARTGVYGGERYRNLGVLLVGSNPSHSPYHKDFDPFRLPRIRSSSWHHGKGEFLATYWLDYLRRHDDLRYRAAGNPGHVTFPRSFGSSLSQRLRSRALTY